MDRKTKDVGALIKAAVEGNVGGLKPRNSFPPRKTLDETIEEGKEGLNSMFFTAVVTGNLAKANSLFLKGADVNAKNEKGVSALKFAKFMGNKEMIEFLESKGAKE